MGIRLQALKYKLTTFLFRHGNRLVDPDWYRTRNLQGSYWQRLWWLHYILYGSRATTHCHPLFDPVYFLQQCNKAGLIAPQKPLKTYLGNRQYWHVNPHPLFDSRFYCLQAGQNPDQSPLMHYINGGHLQHDPHPLFSHAWYLVSFPGLKAMRQHCPLAHYIKLGYVNAISTHPLFHAEHYARQAGITVVNSRTDINLLLDFVTSPSVDISCHPLFAIDFFQKQTARNLSGMTAAEIIITEYLLQPEHWHCNTHILFDAAFYASQTTGKITEKPPLEEYIANNFSVRNPHPLFSTRWYQGRKKNILEFSGQSRVPLVHFVVNGHRMGESPHPLFALQWYRHTYMQGELGETNPLIAFLEQGERQGNRPNPLYPNHWHSILREKHGCQTLADFAKKNPVTLPAIRNRISDAFATGYIQEERRPVKNYLILFTPRSGSSWLTDLISQQKILGKPAEWFNPDLIQSAMNGLQQPCHNIHEYCQVLQQTHRSDAGFFGAELTAAHLAPLRDLVDIQSAFHYPRLLLQLRKNIVAQGVSLFLATESGFFHAINTINKDNTVEYNDMKIKKWINEIAKDEGYFYRFLRQDNHAFHLTWYEDMQANPSGTIEKITRYIMDGTENQTATLPDSTHTKIASSINAEFEEKFRRENTEFLEKIEAQRPFNTEKPATLEDSEEFAGSENMTQKSPYANAIM